MNRTFGRVADDPTVARINAASLIAGTVADVTRFCAKTACAQGAARELQHQVDNIRIRRYL